MTGGLDDIRTTKPGRGCFRFGCQNDVEAYLEVRVREKVDDGKREHVASRNYGGCGTHVAELFKQMEALVAGLPVVGEKKRRRA